MAANENELRFGGKSEANLVKIKVKKGSKIGKGLILALLEPMFKVRSDVVGTVVEILAKEGDVISPGQVLFIVASCDHPVVMKDMCAECGADLREVNGLPGDRREQTSASVAMVHNIPELIISEKQALELGKEDEQRLVLSKKLVLLVDLDQTLLHTTNDNIPPNLKDVLHFQLWHANQKLWYHTKFRPGTMKFLEEISKLYELHICTFGTRMYAHTIASLLDKEEKFFSHRILSRDECFSFHTKTANLKALFPCGDCMVCIIDDREDVWNFAPNLVHVKPYRFFKGTADINAPPGLSKTAENTENVQDPVGDVHHNMAETTNQSVTNNNTGGAPTDDTSKTTDSNIGADNSETKEITQDENCEMISDTNESCTDVDNTDKKISVNKECTESVENPSVTEESASIVENPSVTEESTTIVENPSVTEESTTIVEKPSVTEESTTIVENPSVTEESTTIIENPSVSEESTTIVENPSVAEESTTIVENPSVTEESTTSVENPSVTKESTTSVEELGIQKHENVSEPSSANMCNDNDKNKVLLECEDSDDYLFYLEDILKKIHTTYFNFFEEHRQKGTDKVPDLKNIIPYIRKKVLKGANILFSGIIPTNMPSENHQAYQAVKSLGGNVHNHFVPRSGSKDPRATTHVIAAKSGTEKVALAKKKKHVHIVTQDWLWCCAYRWEWVNEKLFPLYEGSNALHPPLGCYSPIPGKQKGKRKKKNKEDDLPAEKRSRNDDLSHVTDYEASFLEGAGEPSTSRAGLINERSERRSIADTNPMSALSMDDFDADEIRELLEEDSSSSGSDHEKVNEVKQPIKEDIEGRVSHVTNIDDKNDDELIRRKVLGSDNADSSSSDNESLSGEFPHGWKDRTNQHKHKLDNFVSNEKNDSESDDGDDDVESDDNVDYATRRNLIKLPSSGSSDDDGESIGSVDEEMAAAVERELLNL